MTSSPVSVFGADWLVPVTPEQTLPTLLSKRVKSALWNPSVLDHRSPRASKHVLVLGHGDPESGSVIQDLKRQRISFIALNLLELMTESQIEITSLGIGRIVFGGVTTKAVDINLKTFQSVFYTPVPFFPAWPSLENQNQWKDVDILFWRWQQFLEALQLFVPTQRWVPGGPDHLGYPRQRKLQDLERAHRLKIQTPEWIMTTQRHALETFSAQNGPVIYRDPLRHIERKKKEWTFTATPKFLGQFGMDGLSEAPHLFQAFIHKRAEYRVVVVGNRTFAMKIVSRTQNSKTDWRTEKFKDLVFSKAKLPAALLKKLVRLAQDQELTIATVDLLEDAEGNLIFLEMNRPGKWLFVELLAGPGITKEIVKNLK